MCDREVHSSCTFQILGSFLFFFFFWAAFLIESLVRTKVDGSHLVAFLIAQCLF